jgi:hypothetical protein
LILPLTARSAAARASARARTPEPTFGFGEPSLEDGIWGEPGY